MAITKNIYTFKQLSNLNLQLSLYRSQRAPHRATLLYFHGGGFIFGERDDLPQAYIDLLVKAGYSLLTVDYPLAPESDLAMITHTNQQALNWFLTHYQDKLGLPHADFYLMGRSAGAYLALYQALQQEKLDQAALGVIAFYGYYSLNEATFHMPSRHYLTYPQLPEQIVRSLVQPHPIRRGDMGQRYPLYLSLRQSGQWMDAILNTPLEAQQYSLTQVDLKRLPPTFIAAATGDTDVPYRISSQMAQLIPACKFVSIDADEHDFDRTLIDTAGMDTYHQLLDWLKDKEKAAD